MSNSRNKRNNSLRLTVIHTAEEHHLFDGVKSVLCAFSGGVDSSVMLDVLCSLGKHFGFTVKAIHINHGIRGNESIRDEEFAVNECKKRNIELKTVHINVPEYAEKAGLSLETGARELRYEEFEKCANDMSCDVVATGHNADDNAETIIYNIARGCSLDGLCGIPYKRGIYVRPLLDVSRADIDEYAEKHNIEYVFDSTNAENEYTRNRIRHSVIPVLKQINPSFTEAVTQMKKSLLKVRECLDEGAQNNNDLYAVVCRDIQSKCPVFCDGETISSIAKSVIEKKRSRFDLKDGYECVTENGGFVFRAKKEEIIIPIFGETSLVYGNNTLSEGLVSVCISDNRKSFNPINNFTTTITLHSAIIEGELTARPRRSGDKIRIGGITKSLKKEFINKKIPSEYRNIIPVICKDGEIVCVPFIGTADKFISRGENKMLYTFSINMPGKAR